MTGEVGAGEVGPEQQPLGVRLLRPVWCTLPRLSPCPFMRSARKAAKELVASPSSKSGWRSSFTRTCNINDENHGLASPFKAEPRAGVEPWEIRGEKRSRATGTDTLHKIRQQILRMY